MEKPRKLGAVIEMSGSPRESVHENFPTKVVTTYQVEENSDASRGCLLKFLCLIIIGVGVLGGLLVLLMRLFL